MGYMAEISEENLLHTHYLKIYNELRKRGLEPKEIAAVIGYERTQKCFDAQGGYDGHWMQKLSDSD